VTYSNQVAGLQRKGLTMTCPVMWIERWLQHRVTVVLISLK